MGNNINKQTNSSQTSNKNTTNNNTINNTTNTTNNNTTTTNNNTTTNTTTTTTTTNNNNTSQNNNSINNCASSNSRIITNDPNENLNHIIQTGIETAQNIQLNLSQNRVTYIKPLSTSNITVTETTTAPGESGAPSTTSAPPTTSVPPTAKPCENISETSTLLQNINNIREQLARLNIDPSQRVYYENCVVPLLTTLYELTASSSTLATAVNFLAVSPVVHPKTSQLRDTTHLVYHINEKCEDVYKVLKKRIDIMLDMC